MEPRTLGFGAGWDWLVCGWRKFAAGFAVQILFAVIFIAIAIVLGLIPVIGGIVLALLSPVFVGGWYIALDRMDRGKQPAAGDLFVAFKLPGKAAALATLGLIMILGELIIAAVALLIGGTAFLGMQAVGTELPEVAAGPGALLATLVILALALALFMAMFYAIPLAALHDVKPVDALQQSFSASLRNILPLTLFGVIYIILAIVATIPLGLGWIILIPVSIAAGYCSFRSIFPEPESKAIPPSPT